MLLDHDALKNISQLIKTGKLTEAETILLKAEPSPASMDKLRRIASLRAREAKHNNDWRGVIWHLETYTQLANRNRAHCLKITNQEPPPHSSSDLKLLAAAFDRLKSQ